MNNFWTRFVYGTLYVAAVLTAVVWHFYLFVVLFSLFLAGSTYEAWKLRKMKGWVGLEIVVLIGFFVILSLILFDELSGWWIVLPFASLILSLIKDFQHKGRGFRYTLSLFNAIVYPGVGFAAMVFLLFHPLSDYHFSNYLFLALLIIVWVNDTFAYLSGMVMGKHKIFPQVSPKKTWEGTIGGFIFALGAGIVFAVFFDDLSIAAWLIYAAIVSIGAVGGDYLESWLKRRAQVKDSGNFLPGHGGALDRLDSVLISAPLAWFYVLLLSFI
ncbi:MAG: phosphatidate cytidylyltransferase [Bacteroidales bacterium]